MVAESGGARGRVVRIATRKSVLALAQTATVVAQLEKMAQVTCELVPITTKGDAEVDRSLVAIGGAGVFVKELMNALLDGRADLAVHSAKDLPTALPTGLDAGAVPLREDARDALVSSSGRFTDLDGLPARARVGTSSLRRAAQVLARRPDAQIVPLRGNVDSRIGKVKDGTLDAAILALAGLRRLGTAALEYATPIDQQVMVPAAGQGALFVQCRADDDHMRALIAGLDHGPSSLAIRLERRFLADVGAGCVAPIGVHAQVSAGAFHLSALIAATDGTASIRRQVEGGASDAAEALRIVETLASEMLAAGGRELIDAAEKRDITTT
jgi:hydroxymethylbilane synthase